MNLDDFNDLMADTAEGISKIVNAGTSDDINYLAKQMASDHRTLVQGKMNLFIAFVNELAVSYERDNFDLRNQAACELAKKIVDQFDLKGNRLPTI